MPKKVDKKPKVTRKQKLAAARTNNNNEGAGLSTSGSDVAVECLENPVTSDTDKNEYRVIRLPNGLTAVLISNHNTPVNQTDCTIEEDAFECEDSDSSDAMQNGQGDGLKWFEKVLKKEKTSQAECKLCINVGSFSETSRVAGESRLVPNVIVKGSKKYPRDDEYQTFLRQHGGFPITQDSCERTSLDFIVTEKFLPDAVDRLAHCFVSPLMKRSMILREKKQLEEEYRGYLAYDPNRKAHLFSGLSDCGHPSLKFGGQYLENMCLAPDERVYKEVLKFRERHYSAHRIAVVIEAKLPLDTLEEYAKESFAKIPNNGHPPDDFSNFDYAACFCMTEFRKMYEMKDRWETSKGKKLELTWTMPPVRRFYRSKPHNYLGWILRHKGKGSLFSYLRKKNWCHQLDSGVGFDDFENNSVWSLFTITITLTDEGYKNCKNVLDATYSYINLMKREGPQKQIFDEIRNIAEVNFRFTEDVNSSNPYLELCENMHNYSPSEYLTGGVLYFDYDPAAIKECLDLLTPDLANVIIFDKDFEEIETVIEESLDDDGPVYFETEYYKCSDIREDWVRNWKNIQTFPEFFLPEANPFIANDFSLISLPDKCSKVPEIIDANETYEIWYKYDTKFRLPECHMCFCYLSPLPMETPENAAMMDMFTNVLRHVLCEEVYPAKIAKLNYEITSFANRLEIRVNGFNQKLPLFIQTITTYIKECSNLVNEEFFQTTKDNQLKSYHKIFCTPECLIEDVKSSILKHVNWTCLEKHTALLNLQLNQFQHFIKHFPDQLFVKCLVQGNMTQSEAIENVKKCVELLNCQIPFINNVENFRINEIPRRLYCCRVENLAPAKRNCCVKNYYQFGETSIKKSVMIDLLILIMNDYVFEELRNLEELNSPACRAMKEDFSLLGYSLTLDNYASSMINAKLKVSWGEDYIEEFRETFDKLLKNLSYKEWLAVKKIALKVKQRAKVNLDNEVSRNWAEIISGERIFDRRERELTAIREFKIQELREGMLNLTADGNSIRKLSIQSFGDAEVEQDSATNNENEIPELEYSRRYYLTYSVGLEDYYFITNIEDFKKKLKASPNFSENGLEKISEKMEKLCQ